jgi:hypothetical protein
MTAKRIIRPWFLWMTGVLIVAGLGFALTPGIPAQTKGKTEKKADEKEKGKDKEAGKKEPKVEPPPGTIPSRVDNFDSNYGNADHVPLIDEHIRKGWKDNNTFPSDRCTDYEFIRRASLDIIGRIPTVPEIKRFMDQPSKQRRNWLVNALLDGKEYGNGTEYAQNFANLWTVHLLTRSGSQKHFQAQMNDWLYNHFKNPAPEKSSSDTRAGWQKMAYELIAGEGETNRNQAVNYLLHNLGEEIKQDQAKNGKFDMVPATSRTTRLFLGIRTQCVQCHDHPFNGEWGQHHFWGINAFLRQADASGRPNTVGQKKLKGVVGTKEFSLNDNKKFNANNLVGYERRNTVYLFTDPSFLNGKKIPKDFKGTRREALAEFIVNDPHFAKAFVNRTWGHFFGKSFTKDGPDDFGEHNPVSHPELFEKLSKDWAESYQHNPKTLVRWICNSQAYGLSSRANKWNDKTEDETLFARMLLKPMNPEQMFDSLMIATQATIGKNKDEKLAAKEAWLRKLVVNFGNDEGEEGSFSGTVIQALMLMNGQDINNAISDPKEGTVAAIVQKRGANYQALPLAVDDMFMAALSRPATLAEKKDIASERFYAFRPGSKTQPTTPQFWTNYYQDIFWALLNSNEFILNH